MVASERTEASGRISELEDRNYLMHINLTNEMGQFLKNHKLPKFT